MLIATLSLALLINVASATHGRTPVDLFCSGRLVGLTHRADLLKLAEEFKSRPSTKCQPVVRSAVLDLGAILEDFGEGLCTVEGAERIRDFFRKYLSSRKDRLENEPEPEVDASSKLPKKLKKFAKAFGMLVSNMCETLLLQTMWQNPEIAAIASRETINFGSLEKLHLNLERATKFLYEPAEIVLPTDFARLTNLGMISKVHVQTKHAHTIRNLKSICENKFQPIYEPLILPSVILGQAGFHFRDKDLKHLAKRRAYTSQIRPWLKIVVLCEGLKMVDAVDYLDGEEIEIRDETGKAVFIDANNLRMDIYRVLTEEEADEVRAKLLITKGPNYTKVAKAAYDKTLLISPPTSERLYDSFDKRLMKALRLHRSKKTSLWRVRSGVMESLLKKFKDSLDRKSVRVLFSSEIKKILRRLTGSRAKTDEEFAKVLVEQVSYMTDNARELYERLTFMCLITRNDLDRKE